MKPSPDSSSLEIYMLGVADFQEVQSLQRRLVYDVDEFGSPTLVLCEHPPTISVGRAGSRLHIVPDDETLRGLGINVHWVNRGGGCVLHLPGQLAAYLAMPLQKVGLTLTDYLDRLHRVIIDVLEEFDLHGSVRAELPGVFLGQARVASVGVAVSRWVAYHGFTINVGPYLDLYDILEEPGIEHSWLRQTSMESRRQRRTSMPRVREALIRSVEGAYDLRRHHVYTQHPMIRRKVLSHAYAPSSG